MTDKINAGSEQAMPVTLTRERAIDLLQTWADLRYEHRRELRIAPPGWTGAILAECKLDDGSGRGWVHYTFTLADLQRGIDRALGKASPFGNWYKVGLYECLSAGTEDCEQADAIMQMAAFNEYVYG